MEQSAQHGMSLPELNETEPYYSTKHGVAYCGDSRELMTELPEDSIDLICTSPPFALLREKKYGNVQADKYIEWFEPFLEEFRRILKPHGSFIIDLGGTWEKGKPYRSLYQYEFLLHLCRPEEEGGLGWHLAQELYWYNPAKLPTPAEWVTIRRIRVKDAVNTVWWLRPTDYKDEKGGRVSNRKVLKPYSDAQKNLMENGYKAKKRPSEHDISDQFGNDNDGAIPPNLLEDQYFELEAGDSIFTTAPEEDPREPVNVISASNTASNSRYHRLCRKHEVERHPARFPRALPEFAIKLTTEEDDVVLDPFAGSNVTGQEAEKAGRHWIALDEEETYLQGSIFRFPDLYCEVENRQDYLDEDSDKEPDQEASTIEEEDSEYEHPDLFSE
jgi:site-specific DNA-methyltransferase (cytosine-N4-specific)